MLGGLESEAVVLSNNGVAVAGPAAGQGDGLDNKINAGTVNFGRKNRRMLNKQLPTEKTTGKKRGGIRGRAPALRDACQLRAWCWSTKRISEKHSEESTP